MVDTSVLTGESIPREVEADSSVLGFFEGIGGASKNSVLVKGGNYLEVLNNFYTVVFDKTETLTKGVLKITEIYADINISKEKVVSLDKALN